MKITLILPSMGRKNKNYIKSWQMQPLSIAILKTLIPKDIEVEFYDDRLEEIHYDQPTDLVLISVETFTAKRAYKIASEYRKMGVKVVLGGFHPTLLPKEAIEYSDAVVVGEAEAAIPKLIEDFKKGDLEKFYTASNDRKTEWVMPDRSIFEGKKYFNLHLIESGRGCRFNCEFCTITRFFEARYLPRPIEIIVEEIKRINQKYYFIVDDNIVVDKQRAKDLFRALIPLKIQWVGQASIDICQDDELLDLMKQSGCVGLLIGFESLNANNLKQMNKSVNKNIDISKAIKKIHRKRIALYAAFVLGYDDDTIETMNNLVEFTKKHKIFIAAFNHLIPYPSTPLYLRLEKEGRLLYEKWWLDERYQFFDVAFHPDNMSAKELAAACINIRKKFFSLPAIILRALNRANIQSLFFLSTFFFVNFLLRKEIQEKSGLPLGKGKN
ncbi:MAG: B12-binding domain-containing radical SAM protein [Candidatus Saganbacteria bacterium]|nr:B12-binding domain-containing radical SAM protein [Candidatus Saganbacteria bacterium]